jgi:hypothetical protein
MAIKKQHQVFIDEMIKHGDQVKAYRAAYPKASEESARVNCYKLLQNTTIADAIKTASDQIRNQAQQEAVQELKEELKGDILTRQKKLEILNKIANGELEIPVKKPVWDKSQNKYVFVPMMEVPDHAARIKAIEVDNKMTGDNAPIKSELTGKDGKPIQTTVETLPPTEVDYSKMPLELRKQLLQQLTANVSE